MKVLPPGTILQLMYLSERLNFMPAGKFVEIGPGEGEVTNLLLNAGWSGKSYDIDTLTIDKLATRFEKEIRSNTYIPINKSFLTADVIEQVDLVISCMVMEHMSDEDQILFLQKSNAWLTPTGMMVGLVPSSMEHWGIEDEIAGHFRRYTRTSLHDIAKSNQWMIKHLSGLTYPISNMLLPLSNFLVKKNERHKLALSVLDRTKESGRRSVKFKTQFPIFLGMLLNQITLYPLHLLQKYFSGSKNALVLFFEMTPIKKDMD